MIHKNGHCGFLFYLAKVHTFENLQILYFSTSYVVVLVSLTLTFLARVLVFVNNNFTLNLKDHFYSFVILPNTNTISASIF